MIKINMGCGCRNFGDEWTHINGGAYEHLDYFHMDKENGVLMSLNVEDEK